MGETEVFSPGTKFDEHGKAIAGSYSRCAARNARGEICLNPAGYRTPHPGRGPCSRHFGCSPNIVDKYLVEEAMEHQLAVQRGFRGYPVDVGPHEALLEEVRRCAGKVRYLDSLLNFHSDEMKPVIEADLRRDLFKERQHLVACCGTAARAGVEERAIRLAEMWGQEIAQIFSLVFRDLRLSPEQLEQAPQIVERHLALLESSSSSQAAADATLSIPQPMNTSRQKDHA